ncbi:MAG: hypothetical protein H0U51_01095 [Propionibacteriales bacterium]|nr:hypothetical protein [Propionibacteriales bacterium]
MRTPILEGPRPSTRQRRAHPDYTLNCEEPIYLGVLRADRTWLLMKGAAERLGGGWARMWHDGVGELIRRRQAWLTANRGSFLAALS